MGNPDLCQFFASEGQNRVWEESVIILQDESVWQQGLANNGQYCTRLVSCGTQLFDAHSARTMKRMAKHQQHHLNLQAYKTDHRMAVGERQGRDCVQRISGRAAHRGLPSIVD